MHGTADRAAGAAWHPILRAGMRACPAAAAPLQNSEIFTLTYGSIVRQLIADFEDLDEVNKQLDRM